MKTLGLKNGDKIFVHTAAMTPTPLLKLLKEEILSNNLKDIQIYHLHIEGHPFHLDDELANRVEVNCFFVGKNVRSHVNSGRASYIPVFLGDIPRLFERNIIDLDLALFGLSCADDFSMHSLGLSVDIAFSAMQTAKRKIGICSKHIPVTMGQSHFHSRDFDLLIEDHEFRPYTHNCLGLTKITKKIGSNVAGLISDGACLQTGIGAIPDATLAALKDHKNLGLHTEMFSDGVIPLIATGAINNHQKKIFPGKSVTSFAMGSESLYKFIDKNPHFEFAPSEIVNNPLVIAKNKNVVAINSAIAVDLTGQVCADSIGHKIYSGVGGQVDFLRGAALSENGKAIIALPSLTNKGVSKITFALEPGSGVVSSRAHVQYVVTEYGVAHLEGKSLKDRAKSLVNIAHPDFRESLSRDFHDSLKARS